MCASLNKNETDLIDLVICDQTHIKNKLRSTMNKNEMFKEFF